MTQHWTIEAQLILDSPLHVGIGKGGLATDAPVRRTGDGSFLLPGRALGGSLRTLATRLASRFGFDPCQALYVNTKLCHCPVCALFGTVEFSADNDAGIASSLWVYDTKATAHSTIRDGVGIDRRTRTASRNVKYDYEIVPTGTRFAIKMRLQPLRHHKEDKTITAMQSLLLLALSEWEAGRGQLGGNVARGLGRFHLDGLTVNGLAVDSADSLIAFLKDRSDHTAYRDVTTAWREQLQLIQPVARSDKDFGLPVATSFITIDFTLDCSDTFLINDPLSALISGFDHAPLITMIKTPDAPLGNPVLSGSSLRGVLRSRAEKIGRTLATDIADSAEHFLDIVPAGDPFASERGQPLATWDRCLDKEPDYEIRPVDLHLADRLFGNQFLGSRLWVRDAHFDGTSPSWTAQDFLAIDPFTGGGKDGAKFDAAPLVGSAFKGQIILHDPHPWELGWLALVLRDLAEGHMTVGFGRAKGYGQMSLRSVSWQAGFIHADDLGFLTFDNVETVRQGAYQVLTAAADGWLPSTWQADAQGWVDAFLEQIETGYSLSKHWKRPAQDTFFDTSLESLYGKSTVEVKRE